MFKTAPSLIPLFVYFQYDASKLFIMCYLQKNIQQTSNVCRSHDFRLRRKKKKFLCVNIVLGAEFDTLPLQQENDNNDNTSPTV